MISPAIGVVRDPVSPGQADRLDYLDAARAFALVLGIVFHASLSFMPVFMGWAVMDVSTSPWVTGFVLVSHSFRMELFFLLAGFWSHWTFHRRGLVAFARTRAWRLGVPWAAGWFLLYPLIISGWVMGAASLRGDYDVVAGLRAGFASLQTLPEGLFTRSHLWFLYYLLMVTGLTVVVRGLLRATGTLAVVTHRADGCVRWLGRVPGAWLLPVVPTAVALWFMRGWAVDTPDQTLRPHGAVLAVYGGFFALGWVIERQREVLPGLTRLRASLWLPAVLGVAGSGWLGRVQFDPGHPHFVLAHAGFAVSYAVMMWALVWLTLGLFRRWCSRPRAWVRYLADSSYWLYLVHLPVVVWLQVALAEVAMPWWLKLTLISAGTIGVGLVSYDLGVRSTWLGALLNGRRRERAWTLRPRGRTE